MKSLLIIIVAVATIHADLLDDGYHYDPPEKPFEMPTPTQRTTTTRAPATTTTKKAKNVGTPNKKEEEPQNEYLPPATEAPTTRATTTRATTTRAPTTTRATTTRATTTRAPATTTTKKAKVGATPPIIESHTYLPPFEEEEKCDFEAWKAKYEKNYETPEEDDRRKSIFEANCKVVDDHNDEFKKGKVGFDLEKNHFMDMDTEEFVQLNTGVRKKKSDAPEGYDYPKPDIPFDSGEPAGKRRIRSESDTQSLPETPSSSLFGQKFKRQLPVNPKLPTNPKGKGGKSKGPKQIADDGSKLDVDWRSKGAVTGVKDQGSCASCWAFASAGVIEAQHFLKTGKLISFSEQNLVDCVKDNDACDGGHMTNAFEWIKDNKGVNLNDQYPYEANEKSCRFKKASAQGAITKFAEIDEGDEKELERVIREVGPVAVGLDAAQKSFQLYKSGVYYDAKCEQEVNHAILLVGYGKTPKGEEFWLGKNSWDYDWGENGYVKIAKNKNNHCGITNLASYAQA